MSPAAAQADRPDQHRPEGRARPDPAEVPDRVRMPLLALITQQSLDEDYQHAAERQRARAERPSRGRSHRTAAVVIAVFGLLVTVSALQTHRNAGVEDESRATLINRIDNQKAVVSRQQDRQARLNARNAAAQKRLSQLTDDQQAAVLRQRRLAAVTGFGAVSGPGIRVTVTQPADADQNSAVRDSDLALLANGLWAAGAEAISINGHRLTATTAIRTSGPAIYVDDIGIAPPYDVEAIGDERTLEAKFYDTSSGLAFAALADQVGFSFTVDNSDALTLAAAPDSLRRLRSTSTDLTPPNPRKDPGS